MAWKTLGYGRQLVDEEDVAAVVKVLRGDSLTCGPAVEAFERAVATECGARQAVAVSNGTSALRLLYRVAGVGPGSRVGVPAITFAATATQALALGAEVVLLDVDPTTLLLTPGILERCRERLDFVIPVHIAGRLCDMPALAETARQRGITLLEDAAHALGSTLDDGTRCGDLSFSRGATFSFHPVKNITTAEGGAIVVNDTAWAERLRSLRHHGVSRTDFRGTLAAQDGGAPWYHEFHEIAGNDRLSDLHAALGTSQLKKLSRFKAERAAIHASYRQAFGKMEGVRLPPPAPGQSPCWHLFLLQLEWASLGLTRREFFLRAARAGLQLQVHYIPLHHQPALAGCQRADTLAGADHAYQRLVSLPCFPGLSSAQHMHVIEFIASLCERVTA